MDFCVVFCTLYVFSEHMGEGKVRENGEGETANYKSVEGNTRLFNYTDTKALASFLFKLPINVPVVYMARDVMILMRENPFRGP
jgi:hypothetical protein